MDPLRLNLPQPEPIKGADLEQFKLVREDLMKLLNGVRYRTHEEIERENATGTDAGKLMKVEP